MRKSGKTFTFILSALFIVTFAYGQTLQDGIKEMDRGRYENAKKIFRSLLNAQPANSDYYYYMGEIFYHAGEMDSAKKYFSKGIELDTKNGLNYAGLGKVQWSQKNSSEAKNNFDQALSISKSRDAKVLICIAEAYTYSETKDLNAALKLLNQALELGANDPNIHLMLGDIYLEQNNGGEAATQYENALTLDKNFAKAHYKLGMLYKRARNTQVAATEFEAALAADSSFLPAYPELAELYYQSKQLDKAIPVYKKYVSLSGNDMEARIRYASFLFLNKDYANAVSEINEILKSENNRSVLYRLLGYSQYELGDYAESMEAMKKFFSHADTAKILASDYEYYARSLNKTGNDSLAAVYFEKAFETDNSKTDLLGQAIQIYIQQKKFKEAAVLMEKMMSISKPSAKEYFELGKTYYYGKEYGKADTAFAKVTELQPLFIGGYMWGARASTQIDTSNALWLAKPHYEKFIELVMADTANISKYKNDLITAYLYVGYYYLQHEDLENTKLYYEKVLEIDPVNEDAQKVLGALKKMPPKKQN